MILRWTRIREAFHISWCIVAASFVITLLLVGCADTAPVLPSSWADQLSVVTQKAKQVNPQATLVRVSAYTLREDVVKDPSLPNVVTGTLAVDFTFGIPNQEREFSIQLRGSTTQITGPYEGITDKMTPAKVTEYQQAVDSITLSPSEALGIALEQGQAFARQRQREVEPDVYLIIGHERLMNAGLRPDQIDKTSAVWSVTFTVMDPYAEYTVQVDAATGEIINRSER
jgi:Peptidase propeptide and YPEB domain